MRTIQTWRYEIPNDQYGQGHGVVVMDSTGYFSAVTDFGNYAFGWWYHGERDFREFIAGLRGSTCYVMGKLGKKDELDLERTVQHVKEQIIEKRRRGRWSMDPPPQKREWYEDAPATGREKARAEWELIEQLDAGDITVDEWVRDSRLDDAWEMPCYTYDVHLRMFAEQFIPRLADVLEGQLRWERTQAVWYEEARPWRF